MTAPIEPESEAANESFEDTVYGAMRRLAGAHLRHERANHTLQPTALVHEAWMRLGDDAGAQEAGKDHFLALASRAMRRVLVDHARTKGSSKRGGDWQRITIAEDPADDTRQAIDVLSLDEELRSLAEVSPRQAEIVELRFFGGLTNEEAASVIGVSTPTVVRDWRVAQAWLLARLKEE